MFPVPVAGMEMPEPRLVSIREGSQKEEMGEAKKEA